MRNMSSGKKKKQKVTINKNIKQQVLQDAVNQAINAREMKIDIKSENQLQ